jgi:hypothetical protein
MAIQFLSGVNITGTTSVSSVSNDDATYTGILVWDGGLLKYRTKAQILSDIGATGNTGTVTSVSIGTVSGITASVANSTTAATISLENTDKGSSQFIYKNIASDSGTATANSNNDTLTIAGGTNVSTARSGDIITITATDTTTNYYVTGISFATGTGVLSLTRNGLTTLTVDLDGRYATSSGVTSVSGTGSVSGLTLSGTVTSTGSLTLGGTLSLTSGNVTTALGFTPYNATNPSGFTNVTNNNQITNGSGYTTNTGTTTASNSQTFTNKGGNISQWTNNSGYITSASMIAAKGSWYPSAVQNINSGGTVGTRTTLSLNTASITARGMSLSSSVVTITDEITALISMNFASKNYATANRTLAAAVVQYRASSGEEWVDLQGTQVYNYDRGTATSSGASTWGFVYNGSGGASVLNLLEGESELRVQFWIEGRASSASGISTVIAGCRLSITEIK